jgi:hypothetical protein
MDYIDHFIGGPRDGIKRKSEYSERYPLFTLRQAVEIGRQVMALYQFEAAQVTGSRTERTYRYVRSLPGQEAHDFLTTHNEWKVE